MTAARYSAHILFTVLFLVFGAPDQISRVWSQPVAFNLAIGATAALIFGLHLFGKNPLDKLLK